MTITGALLFAFPGQMMSLFTEDAQVIAGGITVLRIVAVSEPMFAALIIFEGVFNGIGDTRAPFVFSIISMWGRTDCRHLSLCDFPSFRSGTGVGVHGGRQRDPLPSSRAPVCQRFLEKAVWVRDNERIRKINRKAAVCGQCRNTYGTEGKAGTVLF